MRLISWKRSRGSETVHIFSLYTMLIFITFSLRGSTQTYNELLSFYSVTEDSRDANINVFYIA
jgi:hypothetical protein